MSDEPALPYEYAPGYVLTACGNAGFFEQAAVRTPTGEQVIVYGTSPDDLMDAIPRLPNEEAL